MEVNTLQNQLQTYLKENNLIETLYLEFDNEYIRIKLSKPALVFNEKTQKIEEQKHGLKVKFTENDDLTFDTAVAAIRALVRIVQQKFLL